jgi:hypothetical protein
MAKPNWSTSVVKSAWLTDPPKVLPTVESEKDGFVCYSTFGEEWWCGWKTYSKLWTCQRYGMFLGHNSNQKTFIKNIRTNEIVWRSWEDENPYRMGI